MFLLSRTDSSLIGRWWWTVDRWLLSALGLLILFGLLLVTTASPSVATRIGASDTHFILRHFVILIPSILLMFGISLLTPRQVLALATVLFVGGMIALMLTPVIGVEIKGARRWIHLPGLSIQPSEFVKPAFIVLSGWLLAHPAVRGGTWAKMLPPLLVMSVIGLLVLQPDFGMTMLICTIWGAQLFVAGLPYYLIALGLGGLVAGGFGAYFTFPHVASRIDRFLDPASGDTYQVDRAAEAFRSGGLFGTGLGQGSAKELIPDVHADFIFAAAGEELGLIWCLVLLGLIVFIVMRGFFRAGQGPTLFVTLAATGLVVQFGVQALVNIGSTLQLLPTKGMTLPFISYGGSSLLAMSLGMGMLLALTRKRTHTT